MPFTIALLLSTWSILSIGFLIASIVPTARFAQPIGAIVLYPIIGVSGVFVRVESLPPVLHAVAQGLPLTYAVPLLQGIWDGQVWSAHVVDVAALVVVFVVCAAISAKIFRWESHGSLDAAIQGGVRRVIATPSNARKGTFQTTASSGACGLSSELAPVQDCG